MKPFRPDYDVEIFNVKNFNEYKVIDMKINKKWMRIWRSTGHSVYQQGTIRQKSSIHLDSIWIALSGC